MGKEIKMKPPVNLKMDAEEFLHLYWLFFGMTKGGTCQITDFNNIFATLDKEAKIFYGSDYQSEKEQMQKTIDIATNLSK